MPVAWRIVKEKYANSAFTGQGAADHGGRWNSFGRRVIYTSWAASLTALEILVHDPPLLAGFIIIEAKFDASLIKAIAVKDLPKDWRLEPPAAASTMIIGDKWLKAAESAVLEVPSIIIPHESNYLINPAHPDFKKIAIGKPRAFSFDPRLLK